MATNKNQHFVPRCYLRPFTLDSNNVAINLFNIDRQKLISSAPVKHQCSRDYFYGKDQQKLEDALQFMESSYASALKEILTPNYYLTDLHRVILRRFWLLQYMRTEAASQRAVEMTVKMEETVGSEVEDFKLAIRGAVLLAMKTFVETIDIVDDLKVCLIKNRTKTPFITSDDPAILTNRWHQQDKRALGHAFGLSSAGNIIMLPLSPDIVCVGYDGDVYSIPHKRGWVDATNVRDIFALNQHQLLNCRANIFIHNTSHFDDVLNLYNNIKDQRPTSRHVIHYAVKDIDEGGYTRYRVVKPPYDKHKEALLHVQNIHPVPSEWPRQIRNRTKGAVYTNGTGIGYVRKKAQEKIATNDFIKKRA